MFRVIQRNSYRSIILIYQIVDRVELKVNHAIIVTMRVALYSDSSV